MLSVANVKIMPETRHYCPHCEEKVSLSTLHRHKYLFYKEQSHSWTKKSDVLSDSGDDSEDQGSVLDGFCSDDSISSGAEEGNFLYVLLFCP